MMNNTNGTFLVYTNPGIDSKFLDRKKNSILRLGGNYRTSFPDINSHKPQLLDLGFFGSITCPGGQRFEPCGVTRGTRTVRFSLGAMEGRYNSLYRFRVVNDIEV